MADPGAAQVVSARRRGYKEFAIGVRGLPDIQVTADGPRSTDLVLAGLVACSGRTFDQIVEKMRISVDSVELRATGERAPEPPEIFTRIRLDWRVSSPSDANQVRRALALAEKHCTVLNILRASAEIEVGYEVTGGE